jgi:hypothetical protein
MSKWLNGNINGRAGVQRDLYATEQDAIAALSDVTKRYEAKGLRVKNVLFGVKVTCEVWDADGNTIAVYWLDDEPNSRQPDERLGSRSPI